MHPRYLILAFAILASLTSDGWARTWKPTPLEAAQDYLMIEHRISGAPVVDEHGNLIGLLSEQDCLKVALSAGYHGEYGGRVSEYMTRDVRTVDADTSILEVAKLFLEEKLRRYPVMEGNRLVGQVSRRDVLKALEFLW